MANAWPRHTCALSGSAEQQAEVTAAFVSATRSGSLPSPRRWPCGCPKLCALPMTCSFAHARCQA